MRRCPAVLAAGCGAIGSYLEEACAGANLALTFLDREHVEVANLSVTAYGAPDSGRLKAAVLAERRRRRGGVARTLAGDVRYVLRPGLALALDAAVLCLDRPSAIADACLALWAGHPGLLVLVLTCGGPTREGYMARLFVTPGPCAVCLFDADTRAADRLALGGASCIDTSAPRASADAARGAAVAGARLLGQWLAGERGLANRRVQRDVGTPGEYVIRMPDTVAPGCEVPHTANTPRVALSGSVAEVRLGELGRTAIACVGDDAVVLLGRRAVPRAGLYCPACGARWDSPPLLLPAAFARPRPCACAVLPRPLGTRSTLGAGELMALDEGGLSLAGWGAGPGDEFLVGGTRGRARLATTFDWSELDA